MSPDSKDYLATGANLLFGKGYLQYDGTPFVKWPPLFPTLLAVFGLSGMPLLDVVRFLNASIFGLIIFVSVHLLSKHIRIKVFLILAAISVLLSKPLVYISVMAWTEPLSTLLILLFIIYLPRFLISRTFSLLCLLIFITALSCLQRYIGISLIFTALILIIFSMSEASLIKRFKYAAVFCGFSIAPLFIWLIRNYRLTGTFTGFRLPSYYTFRQYIIFTFDTLTSWFMPSEISLFVRLLSVGLLLFLMAVIKFFIRHKPSSQSKLELLRIRSVATFILIYSFCLIAFSISYTLNRNFERYLAPIYPLIMLWLFMRLESLSGFLNRVSKGKNFWFFVIIGLCVFWLIYSFGCFIKFVLVCLRA